MSEVETTREATEIQLEALFPDDEKAEVISLEAAIADQRLKTKRTNLWEDALTRTEKGVIKSTVANLHTLLSGDSKIKDKLGYNIRYDRVVVDGMPWRKEPHDYVDEDITGLILYCERRWEATFGTQAVHSVIRYVAAERSYDPVVDYLKPLEWDGNERLQSWVEAYLGAAGTPAERIAGVKWMISAVARAMRPGCEAHHCLVLEGSQGIGKSRALRALFGEWFSDRFPDPHDQYAELKIQGPWCVEAAELSTMRKTDVETIKGFLTSPVGSYKRPFDINTISRPRRCVFAATTNGDQYLRDQTGNRRFWPVKCGVAGPVMVDELERAKDQLWAEALHLYRTGATWWPDSQEERSHFTAAQADRVEVDEWAEIAREWLESRTSDRVTVREVAEGALKIEMNRLDRGSEMRIGAAIKACGWVARKTDGKRYYSRPTGTTPPLKGCPGGRPEVVPEGGGRPSTVPF